MLTVCKSLYFGACWPSVPFMLLNARGRRDLCVPGGGTIAHAQAELEAQKKESAEVREIVQQWSEIVDSGENVPAKLKAWSWSWSRSADKKD